MLYRESEDFILQDLIPETIISQKCLTNMGPIRNVYGDMDI